MLEDVEQLAINHIIYRLANPPRIRAALADLSTSLEEVLETIDFLGLQSAEDAASLLDTPFREDTAYRQPPTRFSDGSWRVFYSALEPETAERERAHWCRKEAQSRPPTSRRFHYRELRCRLDGNGYDLRPKHADWPFLTGDTTYPPCQALAREAKEAGATAILSPSARRSGGTTAPVFVRQILSAATILSLVVIEIEASGETRVIRPSP
jgi:hypothetical protein